VTRRQRLTAKIASLGDSAVIVELADTLDERANLLARLVAADIRARRLEWVVDVVPALVSVAVHFEARTADEAAKRRSAAGRLIVEALERAADDPPGKAPRRVEIPVCYSRPFAADLEEVARKTGLAPEEVVRLHVGSPHRVLMIGFAPGHPYIGGLDARLAVPRRATPRLRVDAGAVAIANAQTSIYPHPTPGGWNVIGRTPLAIFDPARKSPALMEAGDAVVFVPISRAEFDRLAARANGA
jgi:inhibitor of KinA